MSLLPLTLVVLAAFIHATWNLLSKRAADAGPTFVFAWVSFLPEHWRCNEDWFDAHWGQDSSSAIPSHLFIHFINAARIVGQGSNGVCPFQHTFDDQRLREGAAGIC
jgi:hypothetical protein